MTDYTFMVSREQATEIFKALGGISNLVKGLASKSRNAAEAYAISVEPGGDSSESHRNAASKSELIAFPVK